MPSSINRRTFLAASAAAGASLAIAGRISGAPFKTKLRKALIGAPSKEVFESWKAAGFEGMETTEWQASPSKAAEARKLAESFGLQIHSVLFGWGNLNGGPAALADGVAKMESALKTAKEYGASTVLYVPCKIEGMPIPDSSEFDIRFDAKTGHLKQAVRGNNAKYKKYIDAHNHAVDAAREGVRKLIPTAKKTGVVIALENVWNNLWVKPDLFANFVASFQSPWVRAYFDIGNHIKFAPPQVWIHTLGKLIVKCHVKDFKLNAKGGGDHSGFCPLGQGSVNWAAVRKALDEVGYNGWMTIEGGGLSLADQSKQLDAIISGK
ncbi:MAG: sugar phosphate isomerase/epimerase family protein [Thermoguttaceae bacterium]